MPSTLSTMTNILSGFRVQNKDALFSYDYSCKEFIIDELEKIGCYIVDTTTLVDALEVIGSNYSQYPIDVNRIIALFEFAIAEFDSSLTFKELYSTRCWTLDPHYNPLGWYVDMFMCAKKIQSSVDPETVMRIILCNTVLYACNNTGDGRLIVGIMMTGYRNASQETKAVVRSLYSYDVLKTFDPIAVIGFQTSHKGLPVHPIEFDHASFGEHVRVLIRLAAKQWWPEPHFRIALLCAINLCMSYNKVITNYMSYVFMATQFGRDEVAKFPRELRDEYYRIRQWSCVDNDARTTSEIIAETVTDKKQSTKLYAMSIPPKFKPDEMKIIEDAIIDYNMCKNDFIGLINWYERQIIVFKKLFPLVGEVPDADTVYAFYCSEYTGDLNMLIAKTEISSPIKTQLSEDAFDDVIDFDSDSDNELCYDDGELFDIVEVASDYDENEYEVGDEGFTGFKTIVTDIVSDDELGSDVSDPEDPTSGRLTPLEDRLIED